MLAEALPVHFNQGPPMSGFLLLHLLEHLGRGRVGFAQPLDEVAIDAAIFLLERNGQGEDSRSESSLKFRAMNMPPTNCELGILPSNSEKPVMPV